MNLAAENLAQLAERVFMIGLSESHFAFGIRIVSQHVGNLLQDQDHADGRQQPLNDARGNEGGQKPRLSDSQCDLNCAADHDR